MLQVSDLIENLLHREGGFVNDPDDPGGATKYGITIHTLTNVRGRKVAVSEVEALTKAEAVQIYEKLYLVRPKIDLLPHDLIAPVFDMYVNAGNRGVKLLQRTLNKFGDTLIEDGSIGPKTLNSAEYFTSVAGGYLVDAYGIERREYYYRLADRRANSRKYARTRVGGKGGWIKRAEEFMSPKYQLSAEQHRQRTAHWN